MEALDLAEDQREALLAEAIHLVEHAVALVLRGLGPSGFDLMTAIEEGAVFRAPDHFVIGLGGLGVGVDQGLADAPAFFLQVVETFFHLGPLGGHFRGRFGSRSRR